MFFTEKRKRKPQPKSPTTLPAVYVLLAFVPIALVLFSIMEGASILKWALLVGLVAFSLVGV